MFRWLATLLLLVAFIIAAALATAQNRCRPRETIDQAEWLMITNPLNSYAKASRVGDIERLTMIDDLCNLKPES
jgi:hypothetical protein